MGVPPKRMVYWKLPSEWMTGGTPMTMEAIGNWKPLETPISWSSRSKTQIQSGTGGASTRRRGSEAETLLRVSLCVFVSVVEYKQDLSISIFISFSCDFYFLDRQPGHSV